MGKKVAILSTVGTSIIQRFSNELSKQEPSKISEALRNTKTLKTIFDNKDLEEAFSGRGTPGDYAFKEALLVLDVDPRGISAELNSIAGIVERLRERGWELEKLDLYLYPTDTNQAKFCAALIYHYLKNYQKLLEDVPLTIHEPVVIQEFGRETFFDTGLVDLVDKFAKKIVDLKKNGYTVIINATAGFKPETTYVTIVGLLAGADEVMYRHETFKKAISLPILPLSVRRQYLEIIEKLGYGKPLNELKQHGIDVEELKARGLVKEKDGFIEVRDWVRKLLELIKD